MRLHTREWGDGDRVAVLLHGMASDSRAWWRVGPAIAEHGYRVIAVDLPGHGQSPPRPDATGPLLVQSLLSSVPARPTLALGHSMGGLVLAMAVDQLAPERAVYVETMFALPNYRQLSPAQHVAGLTASVTMSAAAGAIAPPGHAAPHPRDQDAARQGVAAWDAATSAQVLWDLAGQDLTPKPTADSDSLLLYADPSAIATPAMLDAFRADGFDVATLPGAAHTVHLHVFDAFMDALTDHL